MERQQDYVLRTVEERGIRFIQLWFTDVLGTPKTFNITPAELENALEEGMTFDGSAIDGFSRVQESDVLAHPDPKTFQLLPYLADGRAGRPGGLRHHQPRRHALRGRPPPRAAPGPGAGPRPGLLLLRRPRAGVLLLRAPEPGTDVGIVPPSLLDHGSYFELTTADLASDLRRKTVLTLEDMGIPVEYSQHEDAPSQHEIDLRYTDALTMADTVMTVRLVVKEIAAQSGVLATFMPKPLFGVQGSGMHTHISLFDGDTNAFHDEADEYHLSETGRRFIAGLLRHAGEITAVTNQWVNSYKRLIVGYEAPVYVSWARNNRSALVRVPADQAGQEGVDPHRVPGARLGLQPVPGLRRHPGRRAGRASRGATSCPPRRPPTSTS